MNTIVYQFETEQSETAEITLTFDPASGDLIHEERASWPHWTALSHHQCPHCPLDLSTHPRCPVATALVRVNEIAGGFISHQQTRVTVKEVNRTTTTTVPAQDSMRSLLGLIIATSGCPVTAYFKPMARFHLPFSDQLETLYRVSSMYLLSRYLKTAAGHNIAFDLAGLSEIYADINIVNACMVDRLRPETEKDSSLNAISILDVFAQLVPFQLEDLPTEMNGFFSAYLKPPT